MIKVTTQVLTGIAVCVHTLSATTSGSIAGIHVLQLRVTQITEIEAKLTGLLHPEWYTTQTGVERDRTSRAFGMPWLEPRLVYWLS